VPGAPVPRRPFGETYQYSLLLTFAILSAWAYFDVDSKLKIKNFPLDFYENHPCRSTNTGSLT
jgi:hypothetical protein